MRLPLDTSVLLAGSGSLAWADVLLTLDRGDFEPLGGVFCGLELLRPRSASGIPSRKQV